AKKVLKNIIKAPKILKRKAMHPAATGSSRASRPGPRPLLLIKKPGLTHLVILLALLGISQDVVSLTDFLKPGLSLCIPLILIRVILFRQLTIRLLDFILRSGFRHT